ncbi:MAG TPA: 30S ribosomal protein S2 [Mycoplasmatales bacterium]|jgi:small subunit ribosomal protein S2|nr:30S ribosomal protein S2 [Mycoplasmatales bacterium]
MEVDKKEIDKSVFLEAGVQFGHYKYKVHPDMMKKFVFNIKNGVSIIDLRKTMSYSLSVFQQVKDLVGSGSEVLFVSKKKQASEIMKNAALECESPFMVRKWPGGFLTNFDVLSAEFSKIRYLEKEVQNKRLSKKNLVRIEKKLNKLNDCYEGVLNLKKIPELIFIFGLKFAEHTVAREALKLRMKIISICDTDSNPNIPYLFIPGNDRGLKSTTFFINLIRDAVKEGKRLYNENINDGLMKVDNEKLNSYTDYEGKVD